MTAETQRTYISPRDPELARINDKLDKIIEGTAKYFARVELIEQRLAAVDASKHTPPCAAACTLQSRLDEMERKVDAHLAAKTAEQQERRALVWGIIKAVATAAVLGAAGWLYLGAKISLKG